MRYFKIIILVSIIGSMFILLIGCAHTVMLQPHMGVGAKVGILKGKTAGVFIPSYVLTREFKTHSFFGGNIIVPLGSPVRDLSMEAFMPFYDQVTLVAAKNYEVIDHLIEVSLDDFDVTTGLDAKATITCIISDPEGEIFAGSWEGKGKGTAAAGLLESSLAREQIRKAGNEALTQAFQMMREDYIEYIQNNPDRFK